VTLQEYEAKIASLARLEIGAPSVDGYGQRVHRTDTEEACTRLSLLSREIRCILWSGPYRAWARELTDRADRTAAELAETHGLIGPGRLPRFPGFTSGGIRCPDIP
jgi:hypothetical protein